MARKMQLMVKHLKTYVYNFMFSQHFDNTFPYLSIYFCLPENHQNPQEIRFKYIIDVSNRNLITFRHLNVERSEVLPENCTTNMPT